MLPFFKDKPQNHLLPSICNRIMFVAILSTVVILLFTSQTSAQDLTCNFNQNAKKIKVTCLFGPSEAGVSFINPISSDPSVLTITNVSNGKETINDQTFEKQIVLAELKNIGIATLTIGTNSQTESFEIPAQNPLLAFEIVGVLPLGTVPEGDFAGLDEGEIVNLSIRMIRLEDESIMNVGGFATLKLGPNSEFSFEDGGQGTLVGLGGGVGSVNLNVVDESLGERAQLLFEPPDTGGPMLLTNYQISLAVLQYEEATQAIEATDIPILFNDSSDEPMSTMTFVEESLDSIMVRTVKDADNGNDPLLLLPMFPEGNLVPRYYILEAYPQEATFNTTMTLFYDESEFAKSSIEDESTINLFRFNGVGWEDWEGEIDPANNSVTVDGVSEFSIWAFASAEDNITDVDEDTPATSDRSIPLEPFLEQNYPNPFNPMTTIEFALPQQSAVTLKLFDILGREVATLMDEELEPGVHKVDFDAKDLANGVYFYQIHAVTISPGSGQGFVRTKKLVLLK